MSIRILICGMNGRMGRQVLDTVNTGYRGTVAVGGVDPNPCQGAIPCYTDLSEVNVTADCIIDFSHHSATSSLTEYAVSHNIPLVVATTGQTEEEMAMIRAASQKIPVFYSANYSLGVALLVELAKKAAAARIDQIVSDMHSCINALERIKRANAPAPVAAAPSAPAFDYDRTETGRNGVDPQTDAVASEIAANLEALVGTTEETEAPKTEPMHPVSDTTSKFANLRFGPNYDPTNR